jgi:hypothetical protein
MRRNNPIDTDEMKEIIKNGESPDYSLTEFIGDYISAVSSLTVGENADRAIQLTQIASNTTLPNDVTRIHIQPQAGKHGEPLTVVQKATNQRHRFEKEDAALYDYNVFFYEKSGDILAIFYRKGTSGCKTVFEDTANNVLREKGMKLVMTLVMPLNQYYSTESGTPSQISMKWRVPLNEPSDIADELDNTTKNHKSKSRVIQSMVINLKADESNPIKKIVDNLINNNIDKKTAFAQIATKYLGDDNRDNFNDAVIDLKIGNKIVSKIHFGELENLIGAYNITGSLNTSDLINSLIMCADNYYKQIVEGVS